MLFFFIITICKGNLSTKRACFLPLLVFLKARVTNYYSNFAPEAIGFPHHEFNISTEEMANFSFICLQHVERKTCNFIRTQHLILEDGYTRKKFSFFFILTILFVNSIDFSDYQQKINLIKWIVEKIRLFSFKRSELGNNRGLKRLFTNSHLIVVLKSVLGFLLLDINSLW